MAWTPPGWQADGWQPEGWQPDDAEVPPSFSGTIPNIRRDQNSGNYQYDTAQHFTGADSYSISPAVEAGSSFDTGTGLLTIATASIGSFGPYVVTATNAFGTADSNAFTAAVVAAVEATGGWLSFINTYEQQLVRRRAERKKQQQLEEETEQIPDDTDRQIAQLLREQEAKDARRAELERLSELVEQNASVEAARQYSEKVGTAYARALTQGNYSALEALERELRKAREEEEALLLQAFMLE
jgi:hypothetical protein